MDKIVNVVYNQRDMTCGGCGNKDAYRITSQGGSEHCNVCGGASISSFKFSDVYFKGPVFEPHLADPDKSPKGNFVTSREHKAALMRDLGVRETGDRVHGARVRA